MGTQFKIGLEVELLQFLYDQFPSTYIYEAFGSTPGQVLSSILSSYSLPPREFLDKKLSL
jgi:hypothetical protein